MEKNNKLKYLLPIRCIMFILIFVIGSIITKQNFKYDGGLQCNIEARGN